MVCHPFKHAVKLMMHSKLLLLRAGTWLERLGSSSFSLEPPSVEFLLTWAPKKQKRQNENHLGRGFT